MKCLGQETFFYSTRRMLISVLWTARGKEEHKILAPLEFVCRLLPPKAAAVLWEEKAFWQAPAMLLYINLKYRKVLNHIFDRQLFSAKKALRMKRGRPFYLPLQDHSLQGTKMQYIHIPLLHPLKTPNKLLAGCPTEKFC